MFGAPVSLSAFCARTFLVLQYHNNNGSESAIVKTVELTWVEYRYHVAEPKIYLQHSSNEKSVSENPQKWASEKSTKE
jgi:hypothetical protein